MKKKIFISIGILVTIAVVALGVSYLLSLHKVSFTLSKYVTGATIYKEDKQKVKQITSASHIMLTDGNYYVVPEGDHIATDKIDFTVDKKDKTVSIDPPYSKSYLEALLQKEQPAINEAVHTKYPSLIDGYTLTRGQLYKQGEWFGGLLEPKVSDLREQKDPYRIVLHKQNGTWEVIRRPEYILTSSRYEEVPIDILRAINLIVE